MFERRAGFIERPGIDEARGVAGVMGQRPGRIEAGKIHQTPFSAR